MGHWTLEDINWDGFDSSRVTPDMLKIVKAASLVEYNASDYEQYLKNIFREDTKFQRVVETWAQEEVQHGRALAKWAQLADSTFRFKEALERFHKGFRLPLEATKSVRGSLWGELVSRCMIEIGTSSFYTALGHATQEPVLKEICTHIAADEFRHYKLFYTHLQQYVEKDTPSKWARLRVALGRLMEAEDAELETAFYAANHNEIEAFSQDLHKEKREPHSYLAQVYSYYTKSQIELGVGMALKASGFRPHGILSKVFLQGIWMILLQKRKKAACIHLS